MRKASTSLPVKESSEPEPDKNGQETEEERPHWSTHFFQDYNPESDVVVLQRLTPEEWLGKSIRGHLCKLTPGCDEQWIKENYGGTKFLIQRKNLKTGRIISSTHLIVAGDPKPIKENTTEPDSSSGLAGSPTVNINGVEFPLSGSMAEFERMTLFMKMVEKMFPEPVKPPDINSVLLETLLRRNEQPSTLDVVRELKEAAGLFVSGEAKGGNFSDVVGKVIDNAGPILANLTRASALRSPIEVPSGSLSGSKPDSLPAPELVKPGNTAENSESLDTDKATTSPQVEREPMGEREIVLSCAQQLVKCYRLRPPKKPTQVVTMLDLFIRQDNKAIRDQIRQRYEEVVFDLCEAELEADWSDWNDSEPQIGTREQFKEWCSGIFELYADPERSVFLI